ncbi:UPF0481 protein [Gossypium australe]|uniref:UPF0481 protein n=1 Tax=Gossypium australe TaxID=47621 RepID=A0A5B6VSG2_9ROSI|nr:UPF0481 protein [Gossypium australe]
MAKFHDGDQKVHRRHCSHPSLHERARITSAGQHQTRTKRYHSHTFRNVKELQKAGIWLKASKTSCLSDINFNHIFFVGKLRLPPITFDDSTMNL